MQSGETLAREIGGVGYFSLTEVAKRVGVTRQTIWRWRRDRKIPAGHRFRDRAILFSAEEMEAIHEFANRLERIDVEGDRQPVVLEKARRRR